MIDRGSRTPGLAKMPRIRCRNSLLKSRDPGRAKSSDGAELVVPDAMASCRCLAGHERVRPVDRSMARRGRNDDDLAEEIDERLECARQAG